MERFFPSLALQACLLYHLESAGEAVSYPSLALLFLRLRTEREYFHFSLEKWAKFTDYSFCADISGELPLSLAEQANLGRFPH